MTLADPKNTFDAFPASFPEPWAAEWGEDSYGFWQALIFMDVSYVFRWIKPGTFIMGSP